MKTPVGVILVAVGLVAVGVPCDVVEPAWHSDWATAQRSARKENKPILVVVVCKH